MSTNAMTLVGTSGSGLDPLTKQSGVRFLTLGMKMTMVGRVYSLCVCSITPKEINHCYRQWILEANRKRNMSTNAFSSLVLPPSSPKINASPNLGRQNADFHPSMWDDHFLKYASDSLEVDAEMEKNIEKLKEEVRKILASTEKPLKKAEVIDSIQCLGLKYHFEQEIDEILKQIHNDYFENNEITEIEYLYSTALLFKLLRQHGYPVSPDVFNKFKNERGNFSETITSDVEGMITLFEASHMSIHGEDILDEALAFTSDHLRSITLDESNPFLAAKLNQVLKQCPYRGIPRLEARKYISIYHLHPSHNELLLTLAKLDFNALQNLHKKEIGNICKWWKSLDAPRNFSYSRDRIVECFFCAIAVYFEPQYSKGRSIVAKEAALYTITDDAYDAYGTIDELELFTAAIERWDISCLDDLPEYMKLIYKELLKFYEEIDDEDMRGKARSYRIDYFKKVVMQGYMAEARWLHRNYTSTTEEYLKASLLTSGFTSFSMSSYIGMGDIVTEDIFKWAQAEPKMLKEAAVISRLTDDIVSTEYEQKRKHIPSSVQCYMKEHGVSLKEAIDELRKMIGNAWKDMNNECLQPTQVPMPFLMRVMNLTRIMDVMYKEADAYTHSGGIMKEYIKLLFVDPVPI